MGIVLAELLNEDRPFRPWTDQAHVASEDVKLRQFIEAWCWRRNVPRRRRVVLLAQTAPVSARRPGTCCGTSTSRTFAVQPAAFLAVEDRPLACQLDQERDEQHQGDQSGPGLQGEDNVHGPLDHDVQAEVRALLQADHRQCRRGWSSSATARPGWEHRRPGELRRVSATGCRTPARASR